MEEDGRAGEGRRREGGRRKTAEKAINLERSVCCVRDRGRERERERESERERASFPSAPIVLPFRALFLLHHQPIGGL